MPKKVLIVEDDGNIAELLHLYLEKEGFETQVAKDGGKGVEYFRTFQPDLVLLDIMLPVMDGWSVLKKIRESDKTPVIMLTAKGETEDKVTGLEGGADDYIVKPFAIEELLARLRALLRRISIEGEHNAAKQTTLTYRDLTIEKENRVVRRGDDIIELTKREYELLLTLMENINVVLARDVLLSKVWGYNSDVETNVVDVYVRYIRNKIDRAGEPSYIQTVRGTGYVMRS